MDEVEELEPTRTNPLPAPAAAGTTHVDATVAALLRQAARLRAIELQLAAVYDLRGHTQAMRGAAPGAASDCA